MKTYMANAQTVERKWYIVDANNKPLGRIATEVATLLRGKHKPTFTPHVDTGDHVIILNADRVALTGNKLHAKMYYRHSGHPGGLKSINAASLRAKDPERMLRLAVWGMLPHNSLGRQMIRKLKVYAGDKHPHQAQQPEVWER